jgi:poly-gamma-glutamate synthesis protein (capsule biosynthesis protein)
MILLLGDWVPELAQPIVEVETLNEFVFLNLEGPIIQNLADYPKAHKSGPHIYSSQLPILDDAAAVCFAMANNHIKDYGWPGVEFTIDCLRKRKYHWAGVGENENLARQPLLLTVDNYRYAIFSICETQFGRATPTQAGSAIIGPWIYQSIARLKSEVDVVIVSVHLANEFLPWPSPLVQDLYRSLIEVGAKIVHGHHSHVPQGVEQYENGLICYGLGNFMGSFTRYDRFETRHSLGVRIKDISHLSDFDIEPFCFQQVANSVVVRDSNSKQFYSYLSAIQEPLLDRALLEALWQESALSLYDHYGRDTMGLSFTTERSQSMKVRNRFKSFGRQFWRRYALTRGEMHKNQMMWYSMFACLSHRTMMETALGLLCGEIPDVRTERSRELAAAYLPHTIGY